MMSKLGAIIGCIESMRIGEELVTRTRSGWCTSTLRDRWEDKDIIYGALSIVLLCITKWVGEKIDKEVVKEVRCCETRIIREYRSWEKLLIDVVRGVLI